jgi:hypothetical protein
LPELLPEFLPELLPEFLPELLPEFLPELLPEFLPELLLLLFVGFGTGALTAVDEKSLWLVDAPYFPSEVSLLRF